MAEDLFLCQKICRDLKKEKKKLWQKSILLYEAPPFFREITSFIPTTHTLPKNHHVIKAEPITGSQSVM